MYLRGGKEHRNFKISQFSHEAEENKCAVF